MSQQRPFYIMAMMSLLLGWGGIDLMAQGGPGGPGGPPPAPFPPMPAVAPAPAANPTTPAKAALGKALFWDEQLSSDNTMACGTCHLPELGGGDARIGQNPGPDGMLGSLDDKFASPGVRRADVDNEYLKDAIFGMDVQVTARTAPTMINAAFAPHLFWDGRASSTFVDPVSGATLIPAGGALESQAVGPILAADEMGHDARMWSEVVSKLGVVTPLKLASDLPADLAGFVGTHADYPSAFNAVFGDAAITPARIGMAIAAYERTLVSNQSPWDSFNAGNMTALTPQQRNGFQVFLGPGRCQVCHDAAQFTDHTFRNIGLRPVTEDTGRFEITGNPADRGRFKVPSLRNVALRNRLMHNGQFASLNQVVNFYAGRGDFGFNIDPVMATINLPPQARADLVAFLGSLTDPRVAAGTAPFDRPTLMSESPVAGLTLYGNATAGSDGVEPEFIADSPPNIGNVDFKVGLRNALGFTSGALILSGFPASIDLFGLEALIAYEDPTAQAVPIVVEGLPASGEGFATAKFPLPNLPALIGFNVYAQWLVYDTGSSASIDYAASQGLQVTFF